MSTHDTGTTPAEQDAPRDGDDTVRERSAEERNIVAPTPKDVRAKADEPDDADDADDAPTPPAADTQAP
ncbi:hypothetical protein [Kitasatospora sp. NPDC094016]|uniref:hypothetical protein n=1 Tax=unclassified Kitasatospora TaxID=2633591 RepID=UPI00331CB686